MVTVKATGTVRLRAGTHIRFGHMVGTAVVGTMRCLTRKILAEPRPDCTWLRARRR